MAVHLPADDRRKTLVKGGGERDLLQRHLGGDRVRTEHEHDRIRPRNQRLDALPPVLERVDVRPVDQRLEAARCERGVEAVDERHVLARVGDEDLGLRLAPRARRAGLVHGHDANSGNAFIVTGSRQNTRAFERRVRRKKATLSYKANHCVRGMLYASAKPTASPTDNLDNEISRP